MPSPTSRSSAERGQLGLQGEQAAAEHLVATGYHILERRWRCAAGEIDIVAEQAQELVFVEVRCRRSTRLGSIEETLPPRKQRQLVNLAYNYLQQHQLEQCNWRIDLLALQLDAQGRLQRLLHIASAVEER